MNINGEIVSVTFIISKLGYLLNISVLLKCCFVSNKYLNFDNQTYWGKNSKIEFSEFR